MTKRIDMTHNYVEYKKVKLKLKKPSDYLDATFYSDRKKCIKVTSEYGSAALNVKGECLKEFATNILKELE